MGAALGWGVVAATSLVLGAVLGVVRVWPNRLIGLVLAFGAGALISAVSFELAEEGIRLGGTRPVAIGLAVGAGTYFVCDELVERLGGSRAQTGAPGGDTGTALALGALLDGIPEQAVLGIGLASGGGVSIGLLMAIYVSNLPEAIGSASDMRAKGYRTATITRLWITVAALCALSSVAGYAIADVTSGGFQGGVNGFAAGALLVMLADSMIPDATLKSGRVAGIATTFGFALAAGLSSLTA
jgi:zinc transporter, ZIP family